MTTADGTNFWTNWGFATSMSLLRPVTGASLLLFPCADRRHCLPFCQMFRFLSWLKTQYLFASPVKTKTKSYCLAIWKKNNFGTKTSICLCTILPVQAKIRIAFLPSRKLLANKQRSHPRRGRGSWLESDQWFRFSTWFIQHDRHYNSSCILFALER